MRKGSRARAFDPFLLADRLEAELARFGEFRAVSGASDETRLVLAEIEPETLAPRRSARVLAS